MSSEIAIKVEGLSKCYQIYDTPEIALSSFSCLVFNTCLA